MNAPRHVYVHVPFCVRRCTYCDFAIAVRRVVPVRAYVDAVRRETELAAAPPVPATVYLGGGTPSQLGGEGLADLLGVVGARAAEEVTIEANPDDVTPDAARTWARAGVTRLSLGVQSFSDRVLAWMHRTHDSTAIAPAVAAARAAGIANVSLDIIFAVPEDLRRDLAHDLRRALALEPSHVSLYGLTVEPGTPLARQIARGECRPARETLYEDEYLLAHEQLAGAGLTFYEVSNAARPGFESRHNRAYWRQAAYLGLGPSAHSFDGAMRWWNEPAWAAWQRRVEAGESPIAGRELLNDRQRALEQWYLGLRTSEGVALPDPCPPALRSTFASWERQGWLAAGSLGGAGRLRLTPTGWLRLDELVTAF